MGANEFLTQIEIINKGQNFDKQLATINDFGRRR